MKTKPRVVRFEVTEDYFTEALQQALDVALAPLNTQARVRELTGKKANRACLRAGVTRGERYFLIAAMGHGDERSFSVSEPRRTRIFSTRFTAPEVRESIVHLLSCLCGVKLGPALVSRQRARAFIGYRGNFSCPRNVEAMKHFVAQTAAINAALLAGASESEVLAAARAAHESALVELENDPTLSAYELAAFKANNEFLVGPWTSRSYGRLRGEDGRDDSAPRRTARPRGQRRKGR